MRQGINDFGPKQRSIGGKVFAIVSGFSGQETNELMRQVEKYGRLGTAGIINELT